MKNLKSYNQFKINEETQYDDLFLGKTIKQLKDVIEVLQNNSTLGINDKTIVAMDQFDSYVEADDYAKRQGYSVGRLQGPDPRGIALGEIEIMKWRNLSKEDQMMLDGIIVDIDDKTFILYFTFPD